MKVFVRCHDRSEFGLTQPVISRLKAKGYWCEDWHEADRIVVGGDRREAIRDTLTYFESGKKVDHLGSGDVCAGDRHHYDGLHRKVISEYAEQSGGMLFTLNEQAQSMNEIVFKNSVLVGPPQIDDLPDTSERPIISSYRLICYNRLPWESETIALPGGGNWFMMASGNDLGQSVAIAGPKAIEPLREMGRWGFLRWLRHADEVYGNSSCLCYECPVYHSDDKIHLIGKRNKGRQIVRWDVEKLGSPSDNVIKALEAHG